MNNKGVTLVEVIAGFLLMVVLITSFIKIIKLSSELTTATTDAKKNSLEFEKAYFNGYNYTVDGSKKAFRTESNIVYDKNTISIVEGFFNETTKVFTAYTDNTHFSGNLKDVQLIKIENLYDNSMARSSVYRYYADIVVPGSP